MDNFLVALVGFMGVLAGGIITAWANKNHEISKFERLNRNEAYLAYLNGISRLSFACHDTKEKNAALMAMAEARGRIALFGSKEVVEGLVVVFEHGSDLWLDEARADVGSLITAMRKDSQSLNEFRLFDLFSKPSDPEGLFKLMYGDSPPRKDN